MELFFLTLTAVIWLTVTGASVIHILLRKRNPRGAALWLTIVLLLPVTGPVLYWVLGINRVRRRSAVRAMRKDALKDKHRLMSPARIPPPVSPGIEALLAISGSITGRPIVGGNTVETLYEGNQTFPAMLTAIGAAQRSINLSTYILDRDAVGLRMISALCTAASAGVQVRVLVDGLGTSRGAIVMARKLHSAGASLSVFHPLLGAWLRRPSINMRNHRKLLIVDGRVGFTGGINITSRHFSSRWQPKEPVRDIHFRIGGPVMEAMQQVFVEDWYASTGEVLSGDLYFPAMSEPGSDFVRAVASGPDEDLEKIYQLVLGALRSARERVLIMTPYFIPDRALIQALNSAVLAGVQVDLLLPERSDHPLVQRASMAYLHELIETGVRVVLVPPPFVHSKVMVVDGAWSLIGSANLDPRSFRLNFEFDLEVYSTDLSLELTQYAEDISKEGVFLTTGMLRARPLAARLLEGAVKVFSPYL